MGIRIDTPAVLLNEQGKVAYEGKAYSQNIVDICLGQIS
jgi:hypothetical protein